MIVDIVTHTPTWVFVLLVALVALGLRLTRPNRVAAPRLVAMPVVFATLACVALVQRFGGDPVAVGAWAVAFALVASVGLRAAPRADVAYDPATRTFAVPGSWLPLALMMAIFFTRYVVAVALAMTPALATSSTFAAAVGALYGLTGGAFVARALRVGRVALAARPATITAAAA